MNSPCWRLVSARLSRSRTSQTSIALWSRFCRPSQSESNSHIGLSKMHHHGYMYLLCILTGRAHLNLVGKVAIVSHEATAVLRSQQDASGKTFRCYQCLASIGCFTIAFSSRKGRVFGVFLNSFLGAFLPWLENVFSGKRNKQKRLRSRFCSVFEFVFESLSLPS